MSPNRRRLLELVAVLDQAALAVVLAVAEALARAVGEDQPPPTAP